MADTIRFAVGDYVEATNSVNDSMRRGHVVKVYALNDPAAPVFHVGDWIQDLIDVFTRFPQPQDGPHGR